MFAIDQGGPAPLPIDTRPRWQETPRHSHLRRRAFRPCSRAQVHATMAKVREISMVQMHQPR